MSWTKEITGSELTNNERLALSCWKAFNDKVAFQDHMHKIKKDLTSASSSLHRFGLLKQEWSREYNTFICLLTEDGLSVFNQLHVTHYNMCCEYGLITPCVCAFSTTCIIHTNRCHGTHD